MHQLQRGTQRPNHGGRLRGAKQVRTGTVDQQLPQVVVACRIAANHTPRFAQRANLNHVVGMFKAKMVNRAAPRFAQHARAVRVVHIGHPAVFAGHFHQLV